MSGFGLNVSFEDLSIGRAAAGLTALGRDVAGEILEPVGMALETSTVERFDTNIAPDGEAWEPSLRATITGGRTLTDTGVLRDSIHNVVLGDAVEIGSADIRAPVHQFGATIHAKTGAGLNFTLADGLLVVVDTVTIPKRPFVGLSVDDGLQVVAIGEGALSRAVAGTA